MEKYVLINFELGKESDVSVNGSYSIPITLFLHPTDNFTPDFTKEIVVASNNSQTGSEVDAARLAAVNAYMDSINN